MPTRIHGLTLLQPNPMTCDAAGRLPQWFVADGSIKLRLTDRNGVQLFVGDNLLVVGASSGGGGGSPVDPTTIAATGDMKVAYGTSILSGWVRANGRTIGSSTSGATERANADVQSLFIYLWGADANLAVSGGRGASAAADFAANKTLALPDGRGLVLAGLDDMGNTAAGILTTAYFGASGSCSAESPTRLGASCGKESATLTLPQLPTGITVTGTVTVAAAGSLNVPVASTVTDISFTPSGGGTHIPGASGGTGSYAGVGSLSGTNTLTSNNTSGSAHAIMQPTLLATHLPEALRADHVHRPSRSHLQQGYVAKRCRRTRGRGRRHHDRPNDGEPLSISK
jgi:hypothetical protein